MLNRNSAVTLLLLLLSSFINAQTGKIKGTVTDGNNQPLGFVYVIPEPGSAADVVTTDFDGSYLINLMPGTYTITLKLAGYKSKSIHDVKVENGNTFDLNVVLTEDVGIMDTVQVVAKAVSGSFVKNTEDQKNNAAASEVIGRQLIESRPTTNSSDVIKLASGASIQENRFAVIRGLNDRYNGAYLNGSMLPSTESDRKAFSFDIFPSNTIDNLSINKTATPDMPGEFAGGLIFITTKNIPEKDFLDVSASGAYNTVTTGKTRITYPGGKTDWLGLDDGMRALPGAIPEKENFPVKVADQAEISKFLKNDWALISKTFSPNMNFQFSAGKTIRKKILIDGAEKSKDIFGSLISITYTRNYNFLKTTRKSYTNNNNNEIQSQLDNEYEDKSYAANTLFGAIANFTFKLNDNNFINSKNIFSINSEDKVISRMGTTNPLEVNPTLLKANVRWFTSNKIYSGQLNGEHILGKHKVKISWLGGYSSVERTIPNLRRSVYTRFTTFNDPSDPYLYDTVYTANISISTVSPDNGGGIFYSRTKESMINNRLDVSKSFSWKEIQNDGVISASKKFVHAIELKTGLYQQQRSREFSARQLGLTKYQVVGGGVQFNDSLLYLPEDQIFNPENMGMMNNGKGGFKLVDATKPTDKYNAGSTLLATYFMFDYHFKKSVRLVGGVRYENFRQVLVSKYDNGKPLEIETTQSDFLPSLNAIFSINEKQNIRLCYSHTVNRPEFRELAPFAFYDFNTQFLYSGNANLKRALIRNYDARYEVFAGRGQLLTLTAFYKSFVNPIEQISRADVHGEVYYANVPTAMNKGIEAEFRYITSVLLKYIIKNQIVRNKIDSCRFLNNLTLYANAALIDSKVTLTTNNNSELQKRQLQGQSPYVFNVGAIFNDKKTGWSVSLAANKVGQRIFIVGNVNEPHIWENGRTMLDLQIGKSFRIKKKGAATNTKIEFRLNLRDGLAQNQYFFQDKNNNRKLDLDTDDVIWTTKYGRTISFNIGLHF